MQSAIENKKFTVEEYFIYEESNEIRHEFINGNLYEMSGASREHHFICQNLLFFFMKILRNNINDLIARRNKSFALVIY